MIGKKEFDGYKEIVESKDTSQILAGGNPNAISVLGSEMSVYFARVNNEVAIIKDAIDQEYMRLLKPKDQGGEGLTATAAGRVAEVNVNNKNEASRRQLEYLCEGMDKIAFACSARVRAFNKEGSW